MTSFSENLRFLFDNGDYASQQALAEYLGIDRTVVSKLLSGARAPTRLQMATISRRFNVSQMDLELPPDAFRARHQDLSCNTLVFSKLRSIKRNSDRAGEEFERYRGDYILYYAQTDSAMVLASLLSIRSLSADGIAVRLINPYKDASGIVTAYEYSGYMYVARGFIYIFLEQNAQDYEILSLTLHEARTPRITLLRGIISGVGVLHERSFVAARSVVALRKRQLVGDWRQALPREIGFMPIGSIPEAVRSQLNNERITVDA